MGFFIKVLEMKLKYVISFVCMSILAFNVNAATAEVQEKQQVLNVMKKFTAAVSCNTTPISLKNIYTVERNVKSGSASYYVLWRGNVGCGTGNTNMSSYVTEVHRTWDSLPFTIDADYKGSSLLSLYAFDDNISYGFIESIKKVNSKQFEVVYREGSRKITVILEKQEGGGWKEI